MWGTKYLSGGTGWNLLRQNTDSDGKMPNPRKNDCAQTLLYKAEHKNSQADTFIAQPQLCHIRPLWNAG